MRRCLIALAPLLVVVMLVPMGSAVSGDLKVSPRSPFPGEDVTVTYIVVNEENASHTYTVNLSLDGRALPGRSVEVGASSSVKGDLSFTAPSVEGVHMVSLLVDGAAVRTLQVEVRELAPVSPVVYLIPIAGVVGILFAGILAFDVLGRDQGSERMQEISRAIREGARAFLHRQNVTIALIAAPLGIILGLAYAFTGDLRLGLMVSSSFLLGAFCSALSGYIGMYVSVRSNSRVASASQRSFRDALIIALRGGAVSGLTIISLSMLGVYLLYVLYGFGSDPRTTPYLIVGYGFGASFVALFAQLGGGIYTKAADVGADLAGKLEEGLPEDDPRNPAVIADNVGDNVGDCAGRGADLFESTAAENIGAMILGVALFPYFGINGVMFPLVAIGLGVLGTVVGVYAVRPSEDEKDPMRPLNMGFFVTIGLILVGLYAMNVLLLEGNIWFYLANVVGVATSLAMIYLTQYYTEWGRRPVDSIVASSKTGSATNIITGFSVALETTALTVLVISVSLLVSFYLGVVASAALPGITAWEGGLYGTAMVTIGMLSPAAYILAMDTYGPITDNAGGINEMSGAPSDIRDRTDRLDATGNTTKALTKGYAVGSAALAAFLLFSAYIDSVEFYRPWTLISPGSDVPGVNLSDVNVFIGAMFGAMLIFLFTSLALRAVGRTASAVITEVRRQIRDIPGLLEGRARPEYGRCVDIVTREGLKEMVLPGVLAVLVPVGVGVVLGPESVAATLIVGTIVGVLMATTLNTGGAAWDNAKKFIEGQGLKGSEQHGASVVGDTVGDPFKDTAGPSLHVVIKLLSTVTLVLAPLFLLLR